MFRDSPILLPTDFSEYSYRAAKYAVAFAKKYGCSIHLLHVLEARKAYPYVKKTQQVDLNLLEKMSRKKLEEFKREIEIPGLCVVPYIMKGKAWAKITEHAEKERCSLIVIAAHGRAGLDRFVFGSVAERVVRYTSTPCLIVKHPEQDCVNDFFELLIRRIMLPTDFSAEAENALPYVVSMCREFGAILLLLHVMEMPVVIPEFMPDTGVVLGVDTHEYARELLSQVRDTIAEVPVETSLRTGVPYREICTAVQEMGVDLIVIPEHGTPGLVHAIFGSVAEKVIRRAPCPVLTLRQRKSD